MGLMADWRGIIRVILSLMSSGRLIGFLSGRSVQFCQSLRPSQLLTIRTRRRLTSFDIRGD